VGVTPEESVDAANALFGRHPGSRALHAKGTLCKATFTATPDAGKLTRAAHMQGDPVPATVRVSNGSGDPGVPDYQPDVRGLAVKFYLPDESRTDIVAQTAPRFSSRTPEPFVELMLAQRPGIQMAWRVPMFFARRPGTIRNIPAALPALKPIASYATCIYYALHAFRFVDHDGGSRYVRYMFVPEAGDHRIGLRVARARGRDYLQQEIRARLEQRPARFRLELQIAQAGDDVNDPSKPWPRDRERVNAGTLELTALETERETDGDVLVFDPTRLTDGIELSDDPVLRFRHLSYTESVNRRMNS
jgi:catalase